jgi:2-polyprenyl-6-methoxyphenol hydroxylase-like FAD-dependent oxidoreductase
MPPEAYGVAGDVRAAEDGRVAGETTDVVVAGGGPAGLAASLALARAGVDVTLVERDSVERRDSPEAAFTDPRDGIAHFLSPHAFLPRGVRERRTRLPDVYDTLLAVGANPVRIGREDEELVLLGVRRPVIEWALREAVLREPRVRVIQSRVHGIAVSGGTTGLSTDAGELRAELVVDAMGRTSRVRRWLHDDGIVVDEESSEVGIIYYSRYFRLRPGCTLPPAAHPFGPRGNLGFALYATFPGDNGTFAVALMVPAWDTELKAVKDEAPHEAFCSAMPELRDWVDPDLSEPITGVIPMGALRTTWRAYERARPPGLVAVADAFCHTDPSFALGLSFSLVHAFALADAVCAGDLDAFWEGTVPQARERFELARDVAAARLSELRGEEPHPSKRARLFASLNAHALRDPEVFRATFRLVGFLDTVSSVEDREDVLGRLGPIEQPAPPVTRNELVQVLRTKSMDTGTPSSVNRSRSSFSTQ